MTKFRFPSTYFQVLAIIAFIIVIHACNKNEPSVKGEGRIEVYLADDPGDFEQVLIDVQDVQVNYSASTNDGWQSIPVVGKGTYDLLTLVNDRDTLLASGNIPAGRLQRLRLVLGQDNFVKIQGNLFKLQIPDAVLPGVELKVQQDLGPNLVYKIILDFDVARSVIDAGSDNYILVPAIRTVVESVGGGVRGWVSPAGFRTSVSAIQGTDTIAGSFTGTGGGFVIKGIAEGNYTLHFNPSDSAYRDTSFFDVPVVNKEFTQMDTVHLSQ